MKPWQHQALASLLRVWAGSLCVVASVGVASCSRDSGRGPGGGRRLEEAKASLAPALPNPAALPSALPVSDPSESAADVTLGSEETEGTVPLAFGRPSPSCIRGWSTPPRGSALRKDALDMLRVQPGERFLVEELRYFVGPDDADVMDPAREVERWYVKARTEGEPERRQRWLVRRASVGAGVDAVAPYESKGYGAGTWVRQDAVDPSFADPFQIPCDVDRPAHKCMGLPRELLGCLSGT